MDMQFWNNIVSGIIILAALWIYIMPTLEAYKKQHPQRQAITVLNLLGGWTFFGWVAAMVWAHVKTKPQEQG